MAVVASRALRTPKAKWPAPIDASSSRSETCTSTFTGIAEDSMSSSPAFSAASLRSGGMQTRVSGSSARSSAVSDCSS